MNLIFLFFFSYSLKINQNATAENDISMACKFEPHFEFSNVKFVQKVSLPLNFYLNFFFAGVGVF